MHTRRLSTLALAAALLTPLVAACGGDDDTAVTADDLDGRTFVATSFEPDGIVDGSEITIEFADGRLSVNGGCNGQGGDYTVDDGQLGVGALMSTMMACDDALMTQDQRLAELLSSSPTIALADDTLTLTGSGDDDGSTLVLTER